MSCTAPRALPSCAAAAHARAAGRQPRLSLSIMRA